MPSASGHHYPTYTWVQLNINPPSCPFPHYNKQHRHSSFLTMKGAILLALVAPTLAFVPVKPVVPMAKVHSRKGQTIMQMDPSVMPGLASTPGQPTVESWLMDNADKKLCK